MFSARVFASYVDHCLLLCVPVIYVYMYSVCVCTLCMYMHCVVCFVCIPVLYVSVLCVRYQYFV